MALDQTSKIWLYVNKHLANYEISYDLFAFTIIKILTWDPNSQWNEITFS